MPRISAVFMGSPDFAVPCLRATAARCDLKAVVTQPDRRAGRGQKLVAPAVKLAAEELGVEVWQPTKVRDGSLADRLRALDVDVGIVVAYGRILPVDVLAAPTHGCINVHGSLLPRWRGAAPIQRAVLAGDAVTGISIMQMDEGCDTGPVFERTETQILPHETSGALFDRLSAMAGTCLDNFLARFPGVPPAVAQPHEGVVHAAKLEKSEGAVLWTRPAREVIHHICGMDPWPGATATRGDATLKLFGGRGSPRGPGAPGQVMAVDDDGLHISCADGCVCVAEVQPPGKRRMPAKAYAAGRPFESGASLG
ncbi:MAG: methionyl-tRNA formyltransferase [Nannocystaceae bacterium]